MSATRRFLLIGAALGFAAALSPSRAEINIVTTTADFAAIARAIGGSAAKVDALASGASDPHFVAAKPSMIRRAKDADLLIAVGAELEIGWLPVILSSASNPKINESQRGYLDISQHVSIMQEAGLVSRAQGDVHKSGNPHYMLDPRNGLLAARAIAARMAEIDPGNAAAYRANLATFEATFQRKWTEWQAAFAPLRGKSVVAYHKSLPYLARAFGFTIVGEVEPLPGIAPTVSHLESLAATIARTQTKLLLMEGFYERRSAQFLAEKTGIKVAIIPHNVDFAAGMTTYFDEFDGIAKAVRAAGAY